MWFPSMQPDVLAQQTGRRVMFHPDSPQFANCRHGREFFEDLIVAFDSREFTTQQSVESFRAIGCVKNRVVKWRVVFKDGRCRAHCNLQFSWHEPPSSSQNHASLRLRETARVFSLPHTLCQLFSLGWHMNCPIKPRDDAAPGVRPWKP